MARSRYGRGKPRATKKSKLAKKETLTRKRAAAKPSHERVTRAKKPHPKPRPKPRPKARTKPRTKPRHPTPTKPRASRPTKLEKAGSKGSGKDGKRSGVKSGTKFTAKSKAKVRAKVRGKVRVKARVLTPAQKGARTKLRNKRTRAKGTERQKLNARQRAIAKRRTDRAIIIKHLPHATPRQKRKSREELFDHLRSRFDELREIARKRGQLPDVDYRERHIDSEKNTGEIRIIRIEQELTPETVEPIMYKVRKAASKLPGIHPIWMGITVFTGMGERLIGYGNRVLDANDRDAAQFQTQGIESTGVRSTPTGMLMAIEDILEDYASEAFTVVFCEHIKVMNFSRFNSR